MRRKGISPIIASVLLIAVSLSVAGIFSGWAPTIVQTFTESTEETADQRIECDQASVEMYSASYDGDSELDAAVRNNGNTDFTDESPVNVVAFDQDDLPLGEEEGLEVGEGSLKEVNFTVEEEPDYITVFSVDCGDVNSNLDY